MSTITVVVPTFDEAQNLPPLAAALLALRLPPGDRLGLLVVDDDSPDGTGAVADALAADDDRVRVVHRRTRTGLAGAYREGFSRALAADADVVVQMDADGSHDPAEVPRLLEALREGADVAIGSRYVTGASTTGWSHARRALSRAGGTYARLALGSPVRDLTGGFKAWRAGALERIDVAASQAEGYAFQIETTHLAETAGLLVREVPVTFRERVHGVSKLSAGIALEALWRVPAMRTRPSSGHPHPAGV